MDKYRLADVLDEELQIWAKLDGCEGGDLLGSLGNTIGMAHYSYVDEDNVFESLAQLAFEEIAQHAGNVANPNVASYYGHDEYVDYVMPHKNKIKELWKEAWSE